MPPENTRKLKVFSEHEIGTLAINGLIKLFQRKLQIKFIAGIPDSPGIQKLNEKKVGKTCLVLSFILKDFYF